MTQSIAAELVLVGGGHAHVQILRRWMMAPVAGMRLVTVLDRSEAVYSGMVPGYVAGDYAAAELEIDVLPLARRAGARVIEARALRIDPRARRIELEGRPSISYDVASLDVGSSVHGLDLPGVREHALATRPIRTLVDRVEARLPAGARGRVLLVGSGAAGVELAFTIEARLREAGREPRVEVVSESASLLPGSPSRVARRVERELDRRGIRFRGGVRVGAVEKESAWLGDEREPWDLVVWAAGAAPQALLGASPLPLDEEGYVRVRSTFQVEGFDDLFAAGDCCSLTDHAWVPKAGVYAVRAGPVLDANLRARLRGGALRRFRPQRDYLMLLNLGGRRALGAKWGVAFAGKAVWRLKDAIDRRFMRRFQVLDAEAAPAAGFPTPEQMGMEEMPCGGCAAKLGSTALGRALARLEPAAEDPSVLIGLTRPDDAAALRLPGGGVLLATVDAFRAFADDPWLVGRVAALNAASDVYAKGGRPRHALALVSVPEEDPLRAEETLYQVLAGVRAALDPLGVALVGGHTTSGDELSVGLSITGDLPDGAAPLALDGARPDDRLILSKALGTGVVLAADMRGLASGAWRRATYASMGRANDGAARVARACGAHACTDVSGFGLAGHLGEMLRAGGVSARIDPARLPALPGALPLLARGLRSTAHEPNAAGRRGLVIDPVRVAHPATELLFDPQTSGGLLFAVAAAEAPAALESLCETGDREAALIGVVGAAREDGALFEVAPLSDSDGSAAPA